MNANHWNKATRIQRRGPLQPAHILPKGNSPTGQPLVSIIVDSLTITIMTTTIAIITITITIFNCVLVCFNFHQLHCSGKKGCYTWRSTAWLPGSVKIRNISDIIFFEMWLYLSERRKIREFHIQEGEGRYDLSWILRLFWSTSITYFYRTQVRS